MKSPRLTMEELSKTTAQVMGPRMVREVVQAGKDVAAYRERFPAKPTKYRNKRTTVDGRTFDSKLEAKRFEQLKALQAAGHIKWFLCQVPLWIAPDTRYVVDFQICWSYVIPTVTPAKTQLERLGWITWEDVKGHMTDVSRTKIKTVQHLYGITIDILTKKEIGR